MAACPALHARLPCLTCLPHQFLEGQHLRKTTNWVSQPHSWVARSDACLRQPFYLHAQLTPYSIYTRHGKWSTYLGVNYSREQEEAPRICWLSTFDRGVEIPRTTYGNGLTRHSSLPIMPSPSNHCTVAHNSWEVDRLFGGAVIHAFDQLQPRWGSPPFARWLLLSGEAMHTIYGRGWCIGGLDRN